LENDSAIIEIQDDANELCQQYATKTDDDGDHYSARKTAFHQDVKFLMTIICIIRIKIMHAIMIDFLILPKFGTIEKKIFLEELKLWAIKHKISFVALADLLRILIM